MDGDGVLEGFDAKLVVLDFGRGLLQGFDEDWDHAVVPDGFPAVGVCAYKVGECLLELLGYKTVVDVGVEVLFRVFGLAPSVRDASD